MPTSDELLKQAQGVDLLRFTTAGSVDDGKSTLIGRLLHDSRAVYEDHLASLQRDSRSAGREEIDFAFLTDGLKAEREQGITIDVAYRHFSTPKRRFIIADTPGHEQYTRNMVTGASTANLAVILIDVTNGVTTQSRRHAFIASLLGIPHIVVAINKMDLVDWSREAFESIRTEYAEFCAKLPVTDLEFIPISALKGDNVVERSANMLWYNGPTLLAHLETVHIASDQNLIDLRFPVQYVLRPHGSFRGYSGTVASGIVRVGEEVVVLPSGWRTRVTRIINGLEDVEYAFPPQSVTICVEGDLDIGRGDMLAHPANVPWVTRDVEAMLVWMHEDPMRLDRQYVVKHTTSIVRGRFTELLYRIDPDTLHRVGTHYSASGREDGNEVKTLGLNEIGRVSMHLFRPILCDEYSRSRHTGSFIVIDPITNFTVGAGLIIDRAHTYARTISDIENRQLTCHPGHVTLRDREMALGQRPVTVWLTGLSASGKSTIAYALENKLVEEGRACYVLDGDNIRQGLNRDLGFSQADRSENIRRVAEVARLMNEAGLIVITSFISPFRADRANARNIIGEDRFIEVFVDTPIEICEQRDPKGLYVKARAGEIPDFTGISSPYEPPESPELRLESGRLSVDECVNLIVKLLRGKRILD
ncbi:MAG: sulfate adenylyltransferase subunit CysN [Armatimonadetes bacterium]|nr:sulfate adenylyltransferase subunit CysN [Armatimonadota bacterium]